MVTLADHLLYKQDTNEIQVRVRDIHVHPSFTGETNIYGVKDYDIALLDFGDDKARLPVLSKHIRPICMAASTASAGIQQTTNCIMKTCLYNLIQVFSRRQIHYENMPI